MPTMTLHPLATEYLDRLRKASARLPRGRRDELCAEIEAHLAEAIDPQAPDADALTVLDRLGEPEEIVAAEQPPPAAGVPASAATSGRRSSCCSSGASCSGSDGSPAWSCCRNPYPRRATGPTAW
jgi:hypothetical protein